MNVRAAIYTRISKDLQHDGLGVARQLTDCRRYAEEHGLSILAELEDNDISASGLKQRPSYLHLKQLMEERSVDVVLVFSMDRLHRSMAELVEYIELSRRTDVAIVSITGGRVDLSTADGRFQAHIFGAVAANERDKNQERIKRKHLELAQSGAWPGQRVYGYLKDASVVKFEAEIIRELSERILNGEGFNDIARDLNNRGIPTLTGAQWRASSIIGIARSARIAGHREHHGVISARDCWPAIIDEETSMLLRARLTPGRSGGVSRGGPRKHLLTGLLKCGKCGSGLVRGLAGKTRVPNYRCPKNQGAAACGSISINLKSVEDFLAEALFAVHDQNSDGDGADEDELAAWSERRAGLDARKAKLAELVGMGLMETEEWVLASGAIKKELAEMPEPPRVRPHRTRNTGAELRAAWPTMSTPSKRTLLEDAFVKITVLPRRITTGAKVFDPGRLEPEWRR